MKGLASRYWPQESAVVHHYQKAQATIVTCSVMAAVHKTENPDVGGNEINPLLRRKD